MTEIRKQCYAYSKEGDRCEKKPGHAGDHSVTLTWDDADCYDPLSVIMPLAPIASRLTDAPEMVLRNMAVADPDEDHAGEVIGVTENGSIRRIATPTASASKCVACGHAHKGGTCKCECYSFIG